MLREICPSLKDRYAGFHQYVKLTETERRMGVTRGWRREGMGASCLMDMAFQFGKMKSSGDGWCDDCTTMWMYSMSLNCTLKND